MKLGFRCLLAALAIALTFSVPAALRADGSQTGILTGVVVDADGAALQGVQVTVAGPQAARSGLTDAEGRFRFPALGIGSYQVTAELLGLTATAEAQVFLGKTSEVRLELRPVGEDAAPAAPQAHEWIEVLAEAPLIDKLDTRVGASVSAEFLDELPVQRFYQSVALVLPGIAGGQDGNPNVSGSLRSGNLYLIDGVDTTDPTTGLFGLNLNYESIQEVSVGTAALPAEYGRVSGAVVDVVTRSGSNDYRGLLRWLGTNNDWNAEYDYPVEEVGHFHPAIVAANAGPDDVDQTVALAAGGPVREDRLWFFAAYEDVESSRLGPTAQGLLWDEGGTLESLAGKLTWQPVASSTLVGQHTADSAELGAFTPFNRAPAENRIGLPVSVTSSFVGSIPGDVFALERQTQEGEFTKLQWNQAFSQSFSAELTLARQERELAREPLNRRGLTGDAPHLAVTRYEGSPFEPIIYELLLFNGITDQGFERRPREQGNLAVSRYFRAGASEHDLRAGIDVQRTRSERLFNFPGGPGIDRDTGLPVGGRLFFNLDQNATDCVEQTCPSFDPESGTFAPWLYFNFFERPPLETREESGAVWLSDTIVLKRWLLRLGARLESVEGESIDAGEPTLLVEDTTVAPRASVTYDARGDGKVLFSAAWGRFVEPFLHQYLDSLGDLAIFSGYNAYFWGGLLDPESCASANPFDLSSPCWVGNVPVELVRVNTVPPNRDLRAASVDELVVGFERQVTPTLGVSLHYVDREWNDLWDNVLREVPVAAGGTALESVVDNLDEARRSYRAIQLLIQKRYADGWQLLGSYTHSETEGNLFQSDGFSNFADFRDVSDANLVNRFGLAPYDRRHQLKLFANYQIAFQRVGLSVGNAVRYESGVPFQVETGDPYGIRFVTRRGSDRLPEVFQWDLSLGADVRLGAEMALEAKAEVFNVTDERRVLGVETLRDTGLFGRPRSLADLQAPRSYRFSLGFRF